LKKLLVSETRYLVVDAGMQPFVIVVVKIVGDAVLGVGQVGINGPLASFEHLRFEARLQALGLGVIVAVAASALRAQGLVIVEQFAVHLAAVLRAAIRSGRASRAWAAGPKKRAARPW